jgi:hypothetical protein
MPSRSRDKLSNASIGPSAMGKSEEFHELTIGRAGGNMFLHLERTMSTEPEFKTNSPLSIAF